MFTRLIRCTYPAPSSRGLLLRLREFLPDSSLLGLELAPRIGHALLRLLLHSPDLLGVRARPVSIRGAQRQSLRLGLSEQPVELRRASLRLERLRRERGALRLRRPHPITRASELRCLGLLASPLLRLPTPLRVPQATRELSVVLVPLGRERVQLPRQRLHAPPQLLALLLCARSSRTSGLQGGPRLGRHGLRRPRVSGRLDEALAGAPSAAEVEPKPIQRRCNL